MKVPPFQEHISEYTDLIQKKKKRKRNKRRRKALVFSDISQIFEHFFFFATAKLTQYVKTYTGLK